MEMERLVKRGDIYYLDFGRTTGSEQNGVRPVLVISNKMANRYSPTILVSPVTTSFGKKELPTHVRLNYKLCGLNRESQVLLEQIYTVDKSRLGTYIGSADKDTMDKINTAAEVSIEVGNATNLYERHEIKIIKQKVNAINMLDHIIRRWVSFNRDMDEIKDDMLEREIRINELQSYAKSYGLDYKEYYKPIVARRVENLNVMVG